MIRERAEALEQTDRTDNTIDDRPMGTAELLQRAEKPPVMAPQSIPASDSTERVPLFPDNELGDLRRRWQDVQGSFVDDPRTAVRHADELVASLMTRLAQLFADERGKLEHEWDKGEDVSTEDLRVALQRYRSFFDRLLSI
jgi:hypothetical protein